MVVPQVPASSPQEEHTNGRRPDVPSLQCGHEATFPSRGYGGRHPCVYLHGCDSPRGSRIVGRSGDLLRPPMAVHRPVPRRTRQRRHRRARTAERLLLRLGGRRRVEDDQRRPHVVPDLRLAARRLDRRDRGRAVEDGRRLRRHGRGRHALADLLRQRHVQVDRRGKDVDAHRPRQHTADRQSHRGSDATRTSSSSPRWATSTARTPTAACSARGTAATRGRRSCSRATTSARSIWPSIPPIRRPSTPRSGTRGGRRGACTRRRTVRAAASTSRSMAAVRGSSSRTAFPPKGSVASASRWRAPMPKRVYAIVDAKEGGLYRSDDAGATWTKVVERQPDLGPRLVLRQGRRRSEERRSSLRVEHRAYRSRDGGKTFGEPFKGIARRRRLSPALDLSRRRQPDDPGGDQGAVISVDGLADHRPGVRGSTSRSPRSITWRPTPTSPTG